MNFYVGGLLPVADASKNGLMPKDIYRRIEFYDITTQSGKFIHLFNLKVYGVGCFYLKFGDVTSQHVSISLVDINNRSYEGSVKVLLSNTIMRQNVTANLYAKRQSDNSIDVYVKQIQITYPVLNFSWVFAPKDWYWTYVGTVSEISESELTKIL